MGIRSFYTKKITPYLSKIPYGKRLNMVLLALLNDLQFPQALYPYFPKNRFFSDSEIEDIFKELDEHSIELAKRFMRRQIHLPKGSYIIHPKYFYTPEEQAEYKKLLPELKKTCRKFGFPFDKVGAESLYYHHGLRFAPDYIKNNIAGKLFGDVGGYWGDSALVFMDYSPDKVIIFEPIAENRRILLKTLNHNHISFDKYNIQPIGLSDTVEVFDDMECKPLDEISLQFGKPFGVLKADIEGMGLKFIQGAEQTIRRDRPLLSLAIYHDADEFAGIYQTLKSWDLNYHFEIKQFSPLIAGGELSLFAYPKEWIK